MVMPLTSRIAPLGLGNQPAFMKADRIDTFTQSVHNPIATACPLKYEVSFRSQKAAWPKAKKVRRSPAAPLVTGTFLPQ